MSATSPGIRCPLHAPWSLRVLCTVDALAVAVTWVAAHGARTSADLSAQTGWVVLGVVGIGLAGLTGSAALLSARRETARRSVRLCRSAAEIFEARAAAGDSDSRRFASPVMSHYHRNNCPLVRGKDVAPMTMAEHQRMRRTPCAVCEP